MQHGTVSHNFSVGVMMTRLPATLAPTEQSSQPPSSPYLTQHLPQNCSFISSFIRWSPALWSACCSFSARGRAKILFEIWSWHKKLNTKRGCMWRPEEEFSECDISESQFIDRELKKCIQDSGRAQNLVVTCNFPLVPPSFGCGWRVDVSVLSRARCDPVRCATLGRRARTEMGRGEEEGRHAGPWSQWRTGLGEDEQRRGAESSHQPPA